MDRKHGEGDYKWADGRIYRGSWKDGKQQGDGYMIFPNRTVQKGTWENGKKVESHKVEPALAEAVMIDLIEKEKFEAEKKI
jgi:hypothetical protein